MQTVGGGVAKDLDDDSLGNKFRTRLQNLENEFLMSGVIVGLETRDEMEEYRVVEFSRPSVVLKLVDLTWIPASTLEAYAGPRSGAYCQQEVMGHFCRRFLSWPFWLGSIVQLRYLPRQRQ